MYQSVREFFHGLVWFALFDMVLVLIGYGLSR